MTRTRNTRTNDLLAGTCESPLRRIALALCCAASIFVAHPLFGAVHGNIDAPHARLMVADGASYFDTVSNVDPFTWLATPVEFGHSYEFTVWTPSNNLALPDQSLRVSAVEADGTTAVAGATGCGSCTPALFGGGAATGGDRVVYGNLASPSPRLIKLRVEKAGGPPLTGQVTFWIRAVDTTLAAARFTVNGYQAFFALNNLSRTTPAGGYILYWNPNGIQLSADSFNIPPNGSIQIVKPNGTPIAGALAGGVQIMFALGTAGQVEAREYNFNPTTGQYLTFDFTPVFQSMAGIQF